MTTIPLPLVDGNTLLIDNSSLEVQTTCPRAAQYHVCLKRKTSKEKSALEFGRIIHKALDIRYRQTAPMLPQTPEIEARMLQSLSADFASWSPPEDDFRNHSFAVELINRYGATYPFESFTILTLPDGKPFVEVPFALPLGEIDINDTLLVKDVATGDTRPMHVGTLKVVWTGKIDLAYESQGGLYIMDHKTTSMMGPTFFQDFELAHQMHGYVWAAEAIFGRPFTGYAINALATRRPTKTGKALEFERKVYTISRPHLAEWQTDCIHIINDFVEMVRRGYMPKHTKWCMGKYGACQFHTVCTLPPEHRELMLGSGEFMDVTWSPLHD